MMMAWTTILSLLKTTGFRNILVAGAALIVLFHLYTFGYDRGYDKAFSVQQVTIDDILHREAQSALAMNRKVRDLEVKSNILSTDLTVHRSTAALTLDRLVQEYVSTNTDALCSSVLSKNTTTFINRMMEELSNE